jgi:hypothetical protein
MWTESDRTRYFTSVNIPHNIFFYRSCVLAQNAEDKNTPILLILILLNREISKDCTLRMLASLMTQIYCAHFFPKPISAYYQLINTMSCKMSADKMLKDTRYSVHPHMALRTSKYCILYIISPQILGIIHAECSLSLVRGWNSCDEGHVWSIS